MFVCNHERQQASSSKQWNTHLGMNVNQFEGIHRSISNQKFCQFIVFELRGGIIIAGGAIRYGS
ncbi:MAG: hypothetical protein EB060_05175 [Proteobacteria bacterium]|nr:hypothetical protein [Pseudomonadota bacterium]